MSEAAAVEAAVQKYVDGCKAADPAVVRDAFDPNAIMWGYLGPDYATMSGAEFADNVVATAAPAWARVLLRDPQRDRHR